MTVGVMGSAGGVIPPDAMRKAFVLGQEIARRGSALITGACPGIPHEAVKGAKSEGGFVVGISPALNFKQHIVDYESPTMGYDAIVYTGSGLMGREIDNIRTCDVVIFAGGRSGTLGEFSIAYDEAKVIGVLLGTGGITEHFQTIIPLLQKETGAVIVRSFDPADLMDQLEEVYVKKILPGYKDLVTRYNPDGVLGP